MSIDQFVFSFGNLNDLEIINVYNTHYCHLFPFGVINNESFNKYDLMMVILYTTMLYMNQYAVSVSTYLFLRPEKE